MKVKEIIELLNAELLCGNRDTEIEVKSACGADLMSDVLAFVKDACVLLTGQNNQQVIKTAEMMDVSCIVFVRGKKPNQDVCSLADEIGSVVLSTEMTMFESCGRLYSAGLKPTQKVER